MCEEDFVVTVNPKRLGQEMVPYIEIMIKTKKNRGKTKKKQGKKCYFPSSE